MGNEDELKEEEERLAKDNMVDDSVEVVQGEEVPLKKPMINVLTRAPEGKVYKPTEPTVSCL